MTSVTRVCGDLLVRVWPGPSTVSDALGFSENVGMRVMKPNSKTRNVGQHYAFTAPVVALLLLF